MAVEARISDTHPNTAPPDGMARFMASRESKPEAAVVEQPVDPAAPVAEPVADVVAPVAAAPAADAVLDPETGEPIDNPTRNDRRIAKLWKREQEAIAEAARLRALLDQRNAAPPIDPTQTAGRPDAQALTPDAHLTAAAKARIRPEPDESQIGEGKTYPTWEHFAKDCGIWGGELAAEKRAMHTDLQTRQQAAQAAMAEQVKAYPDFEARRVDSQHLKVGSAILDVVNANPDLAGHLHYWIMTHHDDVGRISALPVGAAYVEMGKVLAALPVGSAAADPTPRKRSSAPAPTAPIGRPTGQASMRPEDATNYSDFAVRRNAQLDSRRRAR